MFEFLPSEPLFLDGIYHAKISSLTLSPSLYLNANAYIGNVSAASGAGGGVVRLRGICPIVGICSIVVVLLVLICT